MSELFTPEGSLALAIAALEVVLGYRFTLSERGRDLAGAFTYVVAVALGFAAGRGLIPASPPMSVPFALRIFGGAVLLAGLFLAGASSKARLLAGRGRLVTVGPYAYLRHPLYVGLTLVLVGGLLRDPSAFGGLAAAAAVAQYVWLGVIEEREAGAAFGSAWSDYAVRTRAILPTTSRR
jgi:protein-S-isoprenylcysteine O-methyltransferase Ste14